MDRLLNSKGCKPQMPRNETQTRRSKFCPLATLRHKCDTICRIQICCALGWLCLLKNAQRSWSFFFFFFFCFFLFSGIDFISDMRSIVGACCRKLPQTDVVAQSEQSGAGSIPGQCDHPLSTKRNRSGSRIRGRIATRSHRDRSQNTGPQKGKGAEENKAVQFVWQERKVKSAPLAPLIAIEAQWTDKLAADLKREIIASGLGIVRHFRGVKRKKVGNPSVDFSRCLRFNGKGITPHTTLTCGFETTASVRNVSIPSQRPGNSWCRTWTWMLFPERWRCVRHR